jgi:hypothetical protein
MFTSVRPNQVFQLVSRDQEVVWMQIPLRGGLMALESLCLLALLRAVQAKRFFEFGTFRGFTTRLLLENLMIGDHSEKSFRSTTIDLPGLADVHFQGDDENLARQSCELDRREYEYSPRAHLVEQLLQNSIHFRDQAKERASSYDFIFIYGNHHIDYAIEDTENALTMRRSGGVVVWHDYGNPQFPQLTSYIRGLADTLPIFHIEDTNLAFSLENVVIPPSLGMLAQTS